jgi:transposase, IS30 family
MQRLSSDLEREVRRLAARGHGLREIGRLLHCSKHAVSNVLVREPRPPSASDWNPSTARLSISEREEIRAGLERGQTFTVIARSIGRAVSTVSREVAANGGRHGYRAWLAHQDAGRKARRPKTPKLVGRLAALVTEGLEEWWSPEEIARRLRLEFPDDPMMWVSHETIYQSLFVQGRGELRRELHRCLRTGRAQRRPRSRLERRGHIPGMVMISERPAEIEDRAVPGHWEGDLIIGQNNRSAVGTLVERASRFVLLLHLPDGREADKVNDAIKKAIAGLPEELMRSITWDQGREMSSHFTFTIDTPRPSSSQPSIRLSPVSRPDDPVPPGLVLNLEEAFRVLEALEDARLAMRETGLAPGLQDELATVIRMIHGRLGFEEGDVL